MKLKTKHIKGEQSKVNIKGNEKEGFTLTLIISYGGFMLIPILTAKGKTKRSLKKYELDKNKVLGTYSNNGWVNCGIIKLTLEEIYKNTKGKSSVLLLDQFSAHTDNFIKEEAEKKNIKLIYVPKGLTYKYQPLDVLINRILKQKAKKLWREEIVKDPNIKITNADVVKHFIEAKKDITSEIIKKSFDKSCFQ